MLFTKSINEATRTLKKIKTNATTNNQKKTLISIIKILITTTIITKTIKRQKQRRGPTYGT